MAFFDRSLEYQVQFVKKLSKKIRVNGRRLTSLEKLELRQILVLNNGKIAEAIYELAEGINHRAKVIHYIKTPEGLNLANYQ